MVWLACPSLLLTPAPGLKTILYMSGGVSLTLLAHQRILCVNLKGYCHSLLQDNAWDNVTYAVIIRDQWTAVIPAWKNKNMFLGTGHLWLVPADTTHTRMDFSRACGVCAAICNSYEIKTTELGHNTISVCIINIKSACFSSAVLDVQCQTEHIGSFLWWSNR